MPNKKLVQTLIIPSPHRCCSNLLLLLLLIVNTLCCGCQEETALTAQAST
jgi:hypothetical protein